MKTLMIDMDNVITDGIFDKYIEEFFSIKINLDETKEYAYVQQYTNQNKEAFWEWVQNKNFYENAPLLNNCREVLQKLNEKYDIYIVTSYLWKETIDISGNNLKNKYNYLRKELPFIPSEKYIFTSNKNLMNFDIKIDDRINNLKGARLKLLFTAWHNKDITNEQLQKNNIMRVNNWKDIEKVLIEETIE